MPERTIAAPSHNQAKNATALPTVCASNASTIELSVGCAPRLPRQRYSASSHPTTAANRTTQPRYGCRGRARPSLTNADGLSGRAGHSTAAPIATAAIGIAVIRFAPQVNGVVHAAATA